MNRNDSPHPSNAGREKPLWFDGIEDVVEVGRHNNDRVRGLIPAHVHDIDSMEITYMDRGMRSYTLDRRQYDMVGGEVLVVLPGDTHATAWPFVPARLYWMKLRIPSSGDAFLNLRGAPAESLIRTLRTLSPRHFLGTSRMKSQLDRLIRYREKGLRDPASAAIVCLQVLEFLLEVIDCAAKRNNTRVPNPWVANVLRYVDAHLASPIRIGDMAAHMGMSIPGFKLRFNREIGVAPMKYVTYHKINKARNVLEHQPARPITKIALDLGFASSQHFATVFRRVCGETPGSFRYRSSGVRTAGSAETRR
jgi:AraC-like DNA-binding protein